MAKEKREKTDSLASKVTWVSRERRVKLVSMGPGERTVLRAPRASRDPVASLAPSDWLARRESLEFPDCLGTPADKDPRAPPASTDSRGPMARRVQGELEANQALEGSEAQRVQEAAVVPGDQPESLAPRAPQAMTALQARQERGDLKGRRDPSVCQDPKDRMVRQEKTGCPVTPDREERRVSKEKPDHQDLEVWSDHRVQLET